MCTHGDIPPNYTQVHPLGVGQDNTAILLHTRMPERCTTHAKFCLQVSAMQMDLGLSFTHVGDSEASYGFIVNVSGSSQVASSCENNSQAATMYFGTL